MLGNGRIGGHSAPFLVAGSMKSAYDIVLWRWFRTVPLPEEANE